MLQPTPGSDARAWAAMRWATFNGFVDSTIRDLAPAEVKVWLALFRDTGRDGLARTAGSDLATRCGMNERSVKRATKELQRRGLLRVVRRGGLNSGPSTYRVFSKPKGEV